MSRLANVKSLYSKTKNGGGVMPKKIPAIVISIVMIIELLGFTAFADYTDSDMKDVQYTLAEATWSMTYDLSASDTSASAAKPITDKSNFLSGQGKYAAVYKVKLPSLQGGKTIETAQFRMTTYYSSARAMPFAYKMSGEEWNMDSLTIADAQKIIDGGNLGSGDNFLANCIEDASFATDKTYRCRYDVTDYAVECMEKGQEYMWIAVTRSSTVNAYPHDTTTDYWKPKLFYTVKNSTVIDTPISQTRLEALLPKAVEGGHPYLMGRKADFDRVKQKIADGDTVFAHQYERIYQKASAYLGTDVKTIENPSVSYLATGFNSAWNIVPYCAFVYLVEGDEAFARRAYAEAEYYADMTSWGDYQYIDNTQAATAVAICYDWLYDWLDDSQKSKLLSALKEKHLDNVKDDYLTGRTTGIARHLRGEHNHAVMNNATIFMQSLAIADDDISYSAYLMANALKNINVPLASMYPDSGWREGAGYWSFVGPMVARMMLSMKTAFGSCLGYEDLDYVMDTRYFPLYSASTEGGFVFNDTSELSVNKSFDKYTLALLAGDKKIQKYSLQNDDLAHPFFCLAYDSEVDLDGVSTELIQKDKLYSESGIATMRSSWNSGEELFAAMAVQPAEKSHGHMNSGTIGFDALGERWITNTGGDSYSLNGYFNDPERWQYYATRAEANSCVVIDPSEDGGQNPSSDDSITEFASTDSYAYAVADLTDTYKNQVSSYKRGIGLFENRRRFVIQDEIKLTSLSEVYSFININDADITILPSGTAAIISKGNKKLYMNVICDNDFELYTMDSVPLASSPTPSGQSQFEHIKKIVIRMSNASDVSLRVSFTPYLIDKELEFMKKDSYLAIDEWGNSVSSLDAEAFCIYKDGEKLDGFGNDKRILYTDSVENSIIEAATKPGYMAEATLNSEANRIEVFVYEKDDKTNNYSYVIYPIERKSEYSTKAYYVTDDGYEQVSTFSSDVSQGGRKIVIFKIPLSAVNSDENYDRVVFNYAAGVYKGAVTAENIRFMIYGFAGGIGSVSNLRYSSVLPMMTETNLLSEPVVTTDNYGYASSGAVYHLYQTDVTDFAAKCRANGMDYMYIGITASNCNIKLYGTTAKAEYPDCRSYAVYDVLKSVSTAEADTICFNEEKHFGGSLVSTPQITVSDGIEAKVRVVNNTSSPIELNLFVASYTGNKMTECKLLPIKADALADTRHKSDKITYTDGTTSVKAFVWDLNTKPITSSAVQ